MTNLPRWLPPPLDWAAFNSDWNAFHDAAHQIFTQEIMQQSLTYGGIKVIVDSRIEDGKEKAFWHITHVSYGAAQERVPDIARTAKISWLRPLLENPSDSIVSVWKENVRKGRGKEARVYIWIESLEYLVVLAERKNHFYLVTAFATDSDRTQRKLEKARKEYTRNSGGSP